MNTELTDDLYEEIDMLNMTIDELFERLLAAEKRLLLAEQTIEILLEENEIE